MKDLDKSEKYSNRSFEDIKHIDENVVCKRIKGGNNAMELWEVLLEPNVWAMTGGSVILGENSKDTIVRESKEELDININANDLKLITKFKTGNVWIDTYILKCDYDISKMKFQEDEVSDVKWATWTEINELVNNGQFIKHRWEFVSKFLKDEMEVQE